MMTHILYSILVGFGLFFVACLTGAILALIDYVLLTGDFYARSRSTLRS